MNNYDTFERERADKARQYSERYGMHPQCRWCDKPALNKDVFCKEFFDYCKEHQIERERAEHKNQAPEALLRSLEAQTKLLREQSKTLQSIYSELVAIRLLVESQTKP